jgi:nickel/cobalt exporter
VLTIGAWLLFGCLRRWRTGSAAAGEHDHPHRHPHPHPHSHGEPPAAHRGPAIAGVNSLGIAGGLVPSTSALVLLIAAVAGGHAAYGLLLALAFGVGMAVVLSGIGIALARGRSLAARLPKAPWAARLAPVLPWLTATAVIGGGVLLTSQALLTRL